MGRFRALAGVGVAWTILCAPVTMTQWKWGEAAGAPPAAQGKLPDPNVVGHISVRTAGHKTILTVHGSATPSFTAYRVNEPPRLVVDIGNGRLRLAGGESRQQMVDTYAVSQVTLDERTADATQLTRVLIGLKRQCSYTVRPDGTDLVVTISAAESGPEPAAPEGEAQARGPEDAALVARRQEAEQALRRAEEARRSAEQELQRLTAAKAELEQQQKQLVAQVAQEKREASTQLETLRQELGSAQQRAATAQAEVQKAEAAQQRATTERDRVERERQQEEGRLAALRATRVQAQTEVEQQQALLASRKAEVARLTQASDKGAQDGAALERALRDKQRIEEELQRMQRAQEERARAEADLTARLARAEQEGQRLLRAQRDQEAQYQPEAAKLETKPTKAELARLARTEAEQAKQAKQAKAEQARQAKAELEEARLAKLEEAKQARAEAEQARLAKLEQGRQAKLEQARLAKAEAEQARLAKLELAKAEQAKAEQARLAKLEQAKAEQARLAKLEQAKAEQARLAKAEQAKAEQARLAKLEQARLAKAEAEQARLASAEAAPVRLARAEPTRTARPAKAAPEHPVRLASPADLLPPWPPPQTETAAVPLRRSVTLHGYDPADAQDEPEQSPRVVAAAADEAPAVRRAAVATQRVQRPEAGGLVQVHEVRFEDDGQTARVIIVLGGGGVETTVYTDQRTAVLRLQGAALPKDLVRTLDATAFHGPVQSISSFPDPREHRSVRLVVSLSARVAPSLIRQGNRLSWEFPRPHSALSFFSLRTATVAAFGPPVPLQIAPRVPISAGRRFRRYEGRRIDLDFKDADIHNILRLLSDVGQVNIVTADDVRGTVTIKMKDVPWDQALDVVLKAKGLGYVREGNLIRVAPQDRLDKEADAENARTKIKVEQAPIETRLIPVSYAKAGEMGPKVAEVLSPRGKVTVDARTNILIVSDMAGNIALAEDLVRNLDTQTPQVLIESRIVEATADFTRQLGIQWGADYTASPATGNGTGLSFPSSVAVAGAATDPASPVAGLGPGAANPNFIVNMPASIGAGSGGGIGLNLGSVTGIGNINLRLSANETSGNSRIISAPRLVTTDNMEATITTGTSIPYQTVSAAGANTSFQEAAIKLSVRPHVTNDGSVLMDLAISRNEPDFVNTGANGQPSILRREVRTQLLVHDGDTAVIGGIYTRNTGRAYQKVPWLADIPILGILFKSRKENDTRGELLVFITPRILNRAERSTTLSRPPDVEVGGRR